MAGEPGKKGPARKMAAKRAAAPSRGGKPSARKPAARAPAKNAAAKKTAAKKPPAKKAAARKRPAKKVVPASASPFVDPTPTEIVPPPGGSDAAPPPSQAPPFEAPADIVPPAEHTGFRALVDAVLARQTPEAFGKAWQTAAAGALAGFAVAVLACVIVVLIFEALIEDPIPPRRSSSIQIGGLLYYAAHRVGIVAELAPGFLTGRLGTFSQGFVFAPLGATLLALAGYLFGGYVSARASGDRGLGGIAAGVRAALLLPLVAFVASFALTVGGEIPGVRFRASYLGAFAGPLILALLAFPAGAAIREHGVRGLFARLREALEARFTGWSVPVAAALRSLALLAGMCLLAGTCATIVQAIQKPHVTGDVLGSGRDIGLILLGIVVLLPSGIAMGMIGATGVGAAFGWPAFFEGVVSIFGGSAGFGGSFGPFDEAGLQQSSFEVPWYALFGLLMSIIVTMRMGFVAARDSGRDTPAGRRGFALRTAVPFTVAMWLLGFMVTATMGAGFFGGASRAELRFQGPQRLQPSITPFDEFDPPPQFDQFDPPTPFDVPTGFPTPFFPSGFPVPSIYDPFGEPTTAQSSEIRPQVIDNDFFEGAGFEATAGPSIPAMLTLPLLWGLAGSWLGAMLYESRRKPAPA